MDKILGIIIWLLTVILYSPLFYELYRRKWEGVDYTHAYFILPISLLIVFLNRKKIRDAVQVEGKGQVFHAGLMLIIGSLLLFILGWRGGYSSLQTFSLIPLLAGLIWYLYGYKTLRLLLFPILYLLLLVPPPMGVLDSITLPMRYFSSTLSAQLLNAMHYPIVREGLLLSIGSHELYMGAPCSGFRSLITMFSLGLVYVYFIKGKLSKSLILVFSIIPFALLGNIIRIVCLCLITYYYGDEAGQGFFHDFSGIIVFLIMISGLIGLEKILNSDKSGKGRVC